MIDKFRPVLEKLIEATRKEAGNLKYDWYQDAKEPGTFVGLEAYSNMQAVQAHMGSDHFKQLGASLQEFVSSPPEIRILKAENVAKK